MLVLAQALNSTAPVVAARARVAIQESFMIDVLGK